MPSQARISPRMKGILLMSMALVCFTGLDTIAKYLNAYLPLGQVLWARYSAAFVIVLLIFNPMRSPGVFRTRRPWIQTIRGSMLLISTALNFVAIRYLQLDQTISILFTIPLIIALLAGPMLGEWIGPRRWVAVIVGFLGTLVITSPWSASVHWAMLFSLAGAAVAALYQIMTRMLAGYDSAATTSVYSAGIGAIASLPFLPFVWQPIDHIGTVLLMIAMGAFAAIGHWFLIKAHELAPAAILAPFVYTQLLWMVISGYLVFGQTPGQNTLVGAGIVIMSGLYLLYRERVQNTRGASETIL